MAERIECVEILETIIEQKMFYNTVKSKIQEKNLAFCNKLILSVLRNLVFLEKSIKQFVTNKIQHKNVVLKYILLAAMAEIMFLNSPDYAVINEYVNIAKKKNNKYGANMINAVLRKFVAQKTNLMVNCDLPKGFYKILQEDYSAEQIKQIKESVLDEAPLDLTIKENHAFWAKELNGTLFANGTVRIFDAKSKISELKGYEDGAWWVQDLSASLPIMLLGDIKNKKVLDLCAAPGGKTAQLLNKEAFVTAVDIDASRMEKLKQNINRLKLGDNLETFVEDGMQFLRNHVDLYDVIVLDAPCSATGIYRKHPEVLHLKALDDVKKQTKIQKEMLKQAIVSVKSGGVVLYCTCSISKHEGEKVIENFLTEYSCVKLLNADINKINMYDGKKLSEKIIDNGVLRTLSYYENNFGGMDSFFAACLIKD